MVGVGNAKRLVMDFYNPKTIIALRSYVRRSKMVRDGQLGLELLPVAKDWAQESGIAREELRRIDEIVWDVYDL